MDVELLELMPSSVLIAPFVSQSGSTQPTYGADVAYQCRISMGAQYVRSADGREVMARGRIYLATTNAFTVRDRVTLPAGYGPTQPPIVNVNTEDDQNGANHVVLVIG